MKTIGIFPASGALGTSTYTHLLKQVPHDKVILISRHPEKVPREYVESGVQNRQASYESLPSDLETAFSGVDVLFLISYPSHVHEYRSQVQLPAINAAHKAGVKHIFYSSLGFALPHHDDTRAEVMRAHLDSEDQLRMLGNADKSFTWTSIREGLYHESFPIYTAFFDPKNPVDEILIPHDGSGPGISWVKRDELGEATATLIAQYAKDPGSFQYVDHLVVLTGPKEWSLGETVEVLSEVAGKVVKIRNVTVDEYASQPQVQQYFDEEKARTWATAWTAIREGETAYVSPTLREILGREPEAFDVTIRRMYAS
ncbi:hypothetical protein HJFPF1_09880 [Paramyrothecium foliicola]|nr:hypothetical protein HJFPF1_09880 [Paramyrothecium foliicola]